jgi:hypothetical protein
MRFQNNHSTTRCLLLLPSLQEYLCIFLGKIPSLYILRLRRLLPSPPPSELPLARVLDALGDAVGAALDAFGDVLEPVADGAGAGGLVDGVADAVAGGADDVAGGAEDAAGQIAYGAVGSEGSVWGVSLTFGSGGLFSF